MTQSIISKLLHCGRLENSREQLVLIFHVLKLMNFTLKDECHAIFIKNRKTGYSMNLFECPKKKTLLSETEADNRGKN